MLRALSLGAHAAACVPAPPLPPLDVLRPAHSASAASSSAATTSSGGGREDGQPHGLLPAAVLLARPGVVVI